MWLRMGWSSAWHMLVTHAYRSGQHTTMLRWIGIHWKNTGSRFWAGISSAGVLCTVLPRSSRVDTCL